MSAYGTALLIFNLNKWSVNLTNKMAFGARRINGDGPITQKVYELT